MQAAVVRRKCARPSLNPAGQLISLVLTAKPAERGWVSCKEEAPAVRGADSAFYVCLSSWARGCQPPVGTMARRITSSSDSTSVGLASLISVSIFPSTLGGRLSSSERKSLHSMPHTCGSHRSVSSALGRT